jgi:hypothetical protein
MPPALFYTGKDSMDPVYEVVSPTGDVRDASADGKKTFGAPPLEDLAGKKLGLIWTEFAHGDTALRTFGQHLGKRYPELELVDIEPGRNKRWGDLPDASIAELAREHGIDGAVVAAGC